jgi:hypothetical protein
MELFAQASCAGALTHGGPAGSLELCGDHGATVGKWLAARIP